MTTSQFIPDSIGDASTELLFALTKPLESMPRDEFVRAWSSLFYLFPELHPDDHPNTDVDWPDVLRPMFAEAWRREELGELSDDEIYPSDAQWCGLYDRMSEHTEEEANRRNQLRGRNGISVGDTVRYRVAFPDETDLTMIIVEWNGDRGIAKQLNTNMAIPPTKLVRFDEIVVVKKAHA